MTAIFNTADLIDANKGTEVVFRNVRTGETTTGTLVGNRKGGQVAFKVNGKEIVRSLKANEITPAQDDTTEITAAEEVDNEARMAEADADAAAAQASIEAEKTAETAETDTEDEAGDEPTDMFEDETAENDAESNEDAPADDTPQAPIVLAHPALQLIVDARAEFATLDAVKGKDRQRHFLGALRQKITGLELMARAILGDEAVNALGK